MNHTTNYNLNKPEGTDFYDKENDNANMDIIDAQLKDHADAISDLNTSMAGMVKLITYTKSYTLAPQTAIMLTATDFGAATPAGYTPVCVSAATSGNNYIVIRSFSPTNNVLILRSVASVDTLSSTATVIIMYVRSGCIS